MTIKLPMHCILRRTLSETRNKYTSTKVTSFVNADIEIYTCNYSS